MLSIEDNERITRVGPGTQAGQWLRRFWHPIAISDRWDGVRTHWDYALPLTFAGEPGTVGSWADRLGNFTGKPTPVRILGEDLVLFRDGAGCPGLIARSCPHRRAPRSSAPACCIRAYRRGLRRHDLGGVMLRAAPRGEPGRPRRKD